MKKYIFLIAAILLMSMAHSLVSQHVLGRWVVPTSLAGNMAQPWQLNFYDGNITYDKLAVTPPQSTNPVSNSGGAYNSNFDLNFHVIGNYIYHNNDPKISLFDNNGTLPEFQIIQKPGFENDYYAIGAYGLYHETCFIDYIPLTYNPTTGNVSKGTAVRMREFVGGFGGIAITDFNNINERTLYTVSPIHQGVNAGGVYKRTISSSGISSETVIIDSDEPNIVNEDFEAYNAECITKTNGDDVIAWVHGAGEYYTGQDPNEILIVVASSSPTFYRFDNINLGIIGGIEFSNINENVIYASTTNGGIIKFDYTTYPATSNIIYVQNAPSNDYQHTFLQTAPDGHIYGVSNDGNKLGRILQYGPNTGSFDSQYEFVFTDELGLPHNVASSVYFPNNDYYTLPENPNHWIPLEITIESEDVSCPGYTDGDIYITVTGGAPPYTIECDPNLPFVWDEDEGYFYVNNIGEGIYKIIITDAFDNEIEAEIIIDVDFDDYDYQNHVVLGENGVPLVFENETKKFAKGFTVKEGTVASFTNSTVLMGNRASIIVESGTVEDLSNGIQDINGAILTINKSTITNHAACNEAWEGIEVRGIRNKSQLPGENGLVYQGKLIVENNSEISNAYNAIKNRNGDDYNTSGGIIIVEDCNFINNKRSIELLSYHNTNPYSADIRLPYISKFKLCTFTYDDNYIIPDDFNAHISMWDVEGLNFYGCVFQNNTVNDKHNGYGLITLDAGYSMLECCTSDFEPCPEIKKCSFYNLYKGIHASNNNNNNRPYVNDAEFINNSIGVYLSSVSNAIIINSNFEVGHNHLDIQSCGYSMGYGIDMDKCYGFAIEDNEFNRFSTIPNSYYTGIRASNCPSNIDIIYNNDFQSLNYGNYAYGTNRENTTDDKFGLKYECNTNSNNTVDFIVTHKTNAELAMIHAQQGINNEMANGNTFSEIVLPEQWSFRQEGTRVIDWYYCPDETVCPNQYPEKVFTNSPSYFIIDPEPVNPCLSHYGNGGDIKLSSTKRQQLETEYALNLSDYDNVKMLYDNLEDGGNTTSELLDVQTAIPDDMWALRTQLLGDSPHLSEEVLKEVADRTDVFPESVIFDIMAANPDEMQKEELLSYLENKEDPLPDYMISILRDLSMGSTYKTVLLNDMSYYTSESVRAAQDIIQSILADSIVNKTDLRNWLDNVGTMTADKQIISSYLSEGDTSNALSLLNILPSLYDLQDEQLDAFNDYSFMINLDIKLMRENRNIYQLDSLEVNDLIWLADFSSGDAKSQARNILEFGYGHKYCDCLYVSDSVTMKLSDKTNDDFNLNSNGKIEVIPNPARDWAEFNYELPLSISDGSIIITDITGSIIKTIEVTGNQGVKLWDTRNIPNGVYLYTLSSNGFSSTNKIIVNH